MAEELNKPQQNSANLLDMCPERARDWETDEQTGHAIVLAPKFGGRFLGPWIQKRLKQPYYRIKLDDYGTAVWLCCDGRHSVRDISSKLKHQFGEKVEPLFDRLALFLKDLERNRFIRYNRIGLTKSNEFHEYTSP